MLQGVRPGHFARFFPCHAVERSAGAGQDQPFDLPAVPAALEALENGGVLGVHGHDLRTRRIRRVHHQLPGTHQGLLVGQGDAFLFLDGGQGRLEPHHAHHGGDHGVRLRHRGSLLQGIKAPQDPGIRVLQAHRQVTGGSLIGEDRQGGAEFAGLLLHALHAGVGGDGGHL